MGDREAEYSGAESSVTPDPAIRERNLELLKRHPAALRAIESVAPYGPDRVKPSKNGEPTVVLPGDDGVERPFHSRYHPRDEARGQLPDEEDPLATFILLGAGLGYSAVELLPRLSPENRLFWLEPDLRLFRTVVEHVDVSEVLARPHTHILLGDDPERFYWILQRDLGAVLAAPIRLVPHGPSIQRHPEFYDGQRKTIDEFSRHGGVILRTSLYLSRFTLKNQSENLGAYLKSPGIRPLGGALEGQPCIIVSAGPSLRRNIAALDAAQGKIPIIAVSTALRPVLAQGITPDFTVLLDYHRVSRRYFEGVDPENAPAMVCDLKATSDGVAAYPGAHLFGNDYLFNTLFEGLFGDRGDLPPASTVAHCAFHFAVHMKADPIILVGQDLSYPGGLLHVPGTAIQTQEFPTTHRFYSLEMRELEYYLRHRPKFVKVPAIPDGEVPTCDVFFTYLKEFEKYVGEYGGQVIDATEGGARIAGTEVAALAEVIARYPDVRSPDFRNAIAAAVAEVPVDQRREKAREILEERTTELAALRKVYEQLEERLTTIIEKNEDDEAADDLVLEVQELHQEAKKYGRIYLMLSQLAQSDVWLRIQEDRRLDARTEEGVARQLRQARRDHTFVAGLSQAAELFEQCLERARDAIEEPAAVI